MSAPTHLSHLRYPYSPQHKGKNMTPSDPTFPSSTSTLNDTGSRSTTYPASAAATSSDDLVNRVAQGAHHTIDQLAERAAPHVHRLQEGLTETEHMVQRRAAQAKEMAGEWTENLRGTVRQHPLTSVAAALAIGALLSRLSR
jgi:ElaB/YqjD/DUF883 family membrane-anchored ribosome-binding protein